MTSFDADLPSGIPGINMAVAMKYMCNSEAFLDRFLRGFIRDFSSSPQGLETYLRKGDIPAIMMLSHSIKSVAGYIGALQLAAAAASLEQAARQKQTTDIPELAGEFRRQLLFILGGVNAYLQDHPAPPEGDEEYGGLI